MDGFIPYIELKRSYKDIREKEKKPEKTYNPQMTDGKPYILKIKEGKKPNSNYGKVRENYESINTGTRHPKSILKFQNENKTIHPTQKPVDLLDNVYLIQTYSNENNIVLDFTMGSGSTGVACKLTNRQFIGIEKDPDIYFSAVNRLWQ
jgi:site-specific DNA-methyltransferase (adenine-specific)